MSYSTIAIIYNPKSTGSSQTMAENFKNEIHTRLPEQKVELIATKHAGHAEELAYSIAKSFKNPLIVSSSGDGGYNEVINGAVKAQAEGARPTTSLLPAGNANDHYRNLHDSDIIDQIVNNESAKIDLLKVTSMSKNKPYSRYAHSYIGIGLTPIAGNELNKTKLNRITESWAVIRSIFTVKPIPLEIDKKVREYDSVIFSNVDRMSKYMKVSQPSSATDGEFEVTVSKQRSKPALIVMLLKVLFIGVKEDRRVSKFSLRTIHKTLVQIDGEISTLDGNSDVLITVDSQVLTCII